MISDEIRCLYETGVEHRRNSRFGDAINAYEEAAALAEKAAASCSSDSVLREEYLIFARKSRMSVELIREINSFVNTDLMNP
ncbi:MAG: hypothetical protein ACI4TM_10310 [Candidatus Cryptobacteroides sp.]